MITCNKCNRDYNENRIFSVNRNRKYCENCWNVLSKEEIIFEYTIGEWFHKDDYPENWEEWKAQKDKQTNK